MDSVHLRFKKKKIFFSHNRCQPVVNYKLNQICNKFRHKIKKKKHQSTGEGQSVPLVYTKKTTHFSMLTTFALARHFRAACLRTSWLRNAFWSWYILFVSCRSRIFRWAASKSSPLNMSLGGEDGNSFKAAKLWSLAKANKEGMTKYYETLSHNFNQSTHGNTSGACMQQCH